MCFSRNGTGMSFDLPKVSVIIPVYNGGEFLSKAMESVIAQTYSDWQIVAVNDGSTDNSLEILRMYEHRLPSKIHIVSQKNSGASSARNRGIIESKGEYIAFLDSDDSWLPEKLEKQVEFLESNKELGLVYSDCYIIDNGSNMEENTYLCRTKPFRGNIFSELVYNNFIPTSTVLVRRKVLDKVGLFNPVLRISQDYDLWLRLAEIYSVDFINQPLAKYRFHNEGISKNVELMIAEDFQILEYWLNKRPELRAELKSEIKEKRARLHYHLMLHYYHNHKIKNAIKEFIVWTSIKLYVKNSDNGVKTDA
jgi:glycosyltransferase involved in cell wall biosynthesis